MKKGDRIQEEASSLACKENSKMRGIGIHQQRTLDSNSRNDHEWFWGLVELYDESLPISSSLVTVVAPVAITTT